MNKKSKYKEISIDEFISAIEKLPSDELHKDEWLRWLKGYDEPGPFDRKPDKERNAKFVYNHLAYPEMLLWLIEAAGVDGDLVRLAQSESDEVDNVRQKTAAIRRCVSWEELASVIWE